MVEARVHQAQAHHGPPEDLAEFGRGGLVGAEAVPGQQRAAGEQDVALALVDVIGYPHVGVAAVAEPVQVGVGLPGALRIPEPRAQDLPPITVPPLAANTMSGSPATGSIVWTSWPRSR